MHAAIAAVGGLLLMLFGRRLSRALGDGREQLLQPSAVAVEAER